MGGAADRKERAVEGRKEEQDGKAVSKYNLDAMDEGRSPMEGRKKIQDGKAVSKSYLDAMDEGRSPRTLSRGKAQKKNVRQRKDYHNKRGTCWSRVYVYIRLDDITKVRRYYFTS